MPENPINIPSTIKDNIKDDIKDDIKDIKKELLGQIIAEFSGDTRERIGLRSSAVNRLLSDASNKDKSIQDIIKDYTDIQNAFSNQNIDKGIELLKILESLE